MSQYYILHASRYVHSLQHWHLDIELSWILWKINNLRWRFWHLYDIRGIADGNWRYLWERGGTYWRSLKMGTVDHMLRSWDKKTEWKPIPFPSTIFLPREQNQNMKSLAMLWYMKYCRRLQMRTDRGRHKRTDGHTGLFSPEAFLSMKKSLIMHCACSVIWHL